MLAAIALGMGLAAARLAYPWLATTELARGADGHGARTLVVEGWLDASDLDGAVRLARNHGYERVLTTGGPVLAWSDTQAYVSSAERAAGYLRRNGLGDFPVIAVPAPASAQERTFLSAVVLREWAARTATPLGAIDVYTANVHARRSRSTFRLALGPAVEVGVVAAAPQEFEAARWWASSSGAKSVMNELISVAWTTCCFWPPAPGSHEERWAVPPVPAR